MCEYESEYEEDNKYALSKHEDEAGLELSLHTTFTTAA